MTTPTEWLSAFQVNTGSTTSGSQFDAQTIGLSNGNVLVAWQGINGVTGSFDIFGTIYDAEGNLIRDTYRIDTTNNFFVEDESDFDIQATNDGGFILVYTENNGATSTIQWERKNANGDTIDFAAIDTESFTDFSLRNPQVAVNLRDNSSVVTYTLDLEAGLGTNLTDEAWGITTVTADGQTGGLFVVGANNFINERSGEVAILADGNIVSVYTEESFPNAVRFRISTPTAASFTTDIEVAPGGFGDRDPVVTALRNGNFVVAWQEDAPTGSNDVDIRARVYSANGVAVSSTILVANSFDNENEPSIVALQDGGFVVAWDNDTTNALEAQRFNANGTAIGSTFTVANTNVTNLTVDVTGDGRILFSWNDVNRGFETFVSIWDPRDTTINTIDYQLPLTNFVQTDVITTGLTSTRVIGNIFSEEIIGQGGNDTLVGSLGSDTLNGGDGLDVADYSNLGERIVLRSLGVVDKGNAGTDRLLNTETIIGAIGERNQIDGRVQGGGPSSFDVNLANNRLTINGIPAFPGPIEFSVENFVDVIGTSNADRIQGDVEGNRVAGGGGSDTLVGSHGNDDLNGGNGFDTADYSTLGEQITLGALGIVEKGAAGTDQILNIERVIGADGERNEIDGTVPGGGPSSFNINLASNRLTINGIPAFPGPIEFTVENFIDVTGTSNSDRILGDARGNRIDGVNGNDTLSGVNGNDTLRGLNGRDSLLGGNGNDILLGGSSNDTLLGGNGNDTLNGGAGSDNLSGQNNSDSLLGLGSRDTLNGGAGNDTLNGGSGDDLLIGSTGNDLLNGSTGNDRLIGGNNNDTLTGGRNNDFLSGSSGNDILTGTDSSGRGIGERDTFVGGTGSDRFRLGDASGSFYLDAGSGNISFARITDFALNDRILLNGSRTNYRLATSGGDTFILRREPGPDDRVAIIEDIVGLNLAGNQFIFV